MILVYLVLAAQYESWVLPFIILLGVPLAVFGALSAQLMRGFANDVFCQVGLVLLVGLAAKNSILIVEFAEQLRERGMSIVDAAMESARIRLRPILMTSFAFILGVMPLAFATGAGAAARNSVGTAVAGGMVASTFLSIVFIPVLYVVIRTLVPGKVRGHDEEDGSEPSGPSVPVTVGVVLALGLALAAPSFAQARDAARDIAAVPERASVFQGAMTNVAALQATTPQPPPAMPAPGQTPALPSAPDQPVMEALPFDQAVARAVEKNTTIQIAATNVLRAEAILQQVRAATLPFVNVSVINSTLDAARGFDGNVVQPQNQTTIAPSFGMPVLAAAQWAARVQQMDRIEVARLNTADVRRQIGISAAIAYLAVITQERLVDVQQRALETSRAQLDYNQRRLAGRRRQPAERAALVADRVFGSGAARDLPPQRAPRAGSARRAAGSRWSGRCRRRTGVRGPGHREPGVVAGRAHRLPVVQRPARPVVAHRQGQLEGLVADGVGVVRPAIRRSRGAVPAVRDLAAHAVAEPADLRRWPAARRPPATRSGPAGRRVDCSSGWR